MKDVYNKIADIICEQNKKIAYEDAYEIAIKILKLPEINAIQVQAGVKPACERTFKLTAKQFFIEYYQEGKCEDITTNPNREFNNAFYQNIYKLMEDYSKSA